MVSCLLLDLLLVFLIPWPCLLPLYSSACGFNGTSVGGKPVLTGSKGPWGHTLGCGQLLPHIRARDVWSQHMHQFMPPLSIPKVPFQG